MVKPNLQLGTGNDARVDVSTKSIEVATEANVETNMPLAPLSITSSIPSEKCTEGSITAPEKVVGPSLGN